MRLVTFLVQGIKVRLAKFLMPMMVVVSLISIEMELYAMDLLLTSQQQEVINKKLFIAAKEGDAYRVSSLIDQGADVNCRDDRCRTPLILAVKNFETVNILLKAKADVNAEGLGGDTPLLCAERAEVCQVLIAAGALINVQEQTDFFTPLIKAAFTGNIDKAKLLIEAGADLTMRDRVGRTALIYAQGLPVAEILIQAGACFSKRDRQDSTSVMVKDDIIVQVCGEALMSVVLIRAPEQLVGDVWVQTPCVIRKLVSGYVADLCTERSRKYWDHELGLILSLQDKAHKKSKFKKRKCVIS